LKDDDRYKGLRQDYETHLTKMLGMVGESDPDSARHAREIIAFETELAKVSWPRADLRNVEKIYHKVDIGGLKELAPQLPWDSFLRSAGYPDVKDINVAVPDFVKGMALTASQTKPDTLQAYLRWKLVDATAAQLSKAFVDQDFSM